ncbi:hypothetical protein N9W11_05170 [Psychrosphaera haliotis]|uniref:hypothetical protein n=1 Tax=Psychrosphaera haliotis TaxID=555083 RepID=UPI0023726C24|nr:hypothetical protein [Psychrosphaera haliotis]
MADSLVTNSLQQQLERLAKSLKLAHAYVIETNDREATEASLTPIYQSFLCDTATPDDFTACGKCKSCLLYQAGSHPDFKLLDGRTQSVGVDDIRAVSDWLNKTPQIAKNQVVSILAVGNMTENAANALLKTLEEPTSNSFLFLVNNGGEKLLPTISSRCQLLKQPIKLTAQLKQEYPNVPDYLVGYANGNETQIKAWQDEANQAHYKALYELFVAWLKNQVSNNQLNNTMQKHAELTPFFVYLIERRCKQMILNNYLSNAEEALSVLSKFNFAQKNIKGQNKELALLAFIQNLESWVK